ncbi:MAG: phosphate-starvation-inducible PsiE family protein [Rhodoluna sp.]|nr:phosphate-starvation-inducible PsiE family protein [Rhodoluna sp.]
MSKESEVQHKVLLPGRWVERVEEVFHIVLGVCLLGIAIVALFFSVVRAFETVPFFPTGMIQAINDILFIIIILEILRTVVARYTDGVFQLQNFLIIGVIAAVRHILTVGASMTLASGKSQVEFDRAVIELGISSGIVVALVFAIFLSRASSNFPSKRTKNENPSAL